MNDKEENHFIGEPDDDTYNSDSMKETVPEENTAEEPIILPETMTTEEPLNAETEEPTAEGEEPPKEQEEEQTPPQESEQPNSKEPNPSQPYAEPENNQPNPNQNPYQSYGQQNPNQPNQNPYQPYGQQYSNNPYQRPYQPYGQQNPYNQSQNPYQPYGQQYPYNQYQNPYQPYGQQYPYHQNQNPYQPYQQQNPYYPQNNAPVQPPKKMSTGLKVFLWLFGIIAALCVIGFLVVGIVESVQDFQGQSHSSQSEQLPNDKGNGSQSGAESQAPSNSGGKTDPNNEGIILESQPNGEKLDPHDIYQNVVESVVGIKTAFTDDSEVSQGSGIIATADGYIITNAHVVGNSKTNKVSVILHGDEKEYAASVVGIDSATDLAILKIDKSGLHPATFGNSDQLQVGDWVLAIGNPGGVNFASTLTGGYVSALNRKLKTSTSNEMTYIQTDAAINPGNSGGPLVNMYGQVVGINSNKIVAEGYEGMGFAIPTSRAKDVLDDLITKGYVAGRARLGITVRDVTAEEVQLSGLPEGVVVLDIGAESDFQNKGVVKGDIITEIDGQKITAKSDLFDLLAKHKPGDVVKVTIYSSTKNGKEKQISIKLLEGKQ